MSKKLKPLPPFIDEKELSKFIETNIELRKETLISRIAGKVNYPFFQLIKLLQFYSIRKDQDGNLYLM
jgi:hypothetical protein